MMLLRRAGFMVVAAAAAASLLPAAAPGATVRNYDLGVIHLPDGSVKGPLPVRLWGAIGVPSGAGPHPLVVVGHGRHGDNCPDAPGGDAHDYVWPCWAREQRNDLGLRHIVAALAARGVAAIAPDLNAAYTIGWGEPDDRRRWPSIVRRVLAEVAKDVNGGPQRFGVRLRGRLDLGRRGILGHSRSGHHGVLLARRSRVRSLFLLAPVHERAALPDRPTALVGSACDADVPGEARRYFTRARRQGGRRRPVFFIELEHANHNWYNRTLARLGRDDGRFASGAGCRNGQRLRPRPQQRWVDRAAAAFFDATLDGGPRPDWMRRAAPEADRLYGLEVTIDRLFP